MATYFLSCTQGNPPPKDNGIKEHVKLKQEFLNKYFSSYSFIRKQAIDSLNLYAVDSLRYVAPQILYGGWQIDSLLFFSSDSTRFYTKLHGNSGAIKDDPADSFDDFGGALIDGKWYFFKMGTVTYVPRGDYHHDPYEPLTFEELSYIAWRGSIPGLIYRQEDGSLATNHQAIDQMFFSTDKYYCPDPETIRTCRDSFHVATLRRSLQSKLKKKEILEIQEEIASSKKPYVAPYKELTDKDRRRGKKEKLFDSQAWKERYDYKNEIKDEES
jgi:hypothetical protein